MGLLDPPSRFEVAADLPPPPPGTRNHCEWVRDVDGWIWLRKRLTWVGLVGEAVAVEVAERFEVELADGAVDVGSQCWFSHRLNFLSWDVVHGPRVDPGFLARLILFDLALGVEDRHGGNILLGPSGDLFRPFAIDHDLLLVARQGRQDVPILHRLPGARLADPTLVRELRERARPWVYARSCDLSALDQLFPDQDIPGVQDSLRERCRALPDLVEIWIGAHKETPE